MMADIYCCCAFIKIIIFDVNDVSWSQIVLEMSFIKINSWQDIDD